MQEARELANDPCTDYTAAPLEVCIHNLYISTHLMNHLERHICEHRRSINKHLYSPNRNGTVHCADQLAPSSRPAYTISEFYYLQNILFGLLQF